MLEAGVVLWWHGSHSEVLNRGGVAKIAEPGQMVVPHGCRTGADAPRAATRDVLHARVAITAHGVQ